MLRNCDLRQNNIRLMLFRWLRLSGSCFGCRDSHILISGTVVEEPLRTRADEPFHKNNVGHLPHFLPPRDKIKDGCPGARKNLRWVPAANTCWPLSPSTDRGRIFFTYTPPKSAGGTSWFFDACDQGAPPHPDRSCGPLSRKARAGMMEDGLLAARMNPCPFAPRPSRDRRRYKAGSHGTVIVLCGGR